MNNHCNTETVIIWTGFMWLAVQFAGELQFLWHCAEFCSNKELFLCKNAVKLESYLPYQFCHMALYVQLHHVCGLCQMSAVSTAEVM
jgi:hypothetical protein